MVSATLAPKEGHPVELEEDKVFTQLQDSPIFRQASVIMDMISTLKGQNNYSSEQVC